nr:histidine kinase dimerization/phosphoacceptor domain-containing protein [Actinomadura hibisca]
MDAPAVPRASRRPSLETAVAAGVVVLVVAATAGQALNSPAQTPARTVLDWALILTACGAMAVVRAHPVPACLYVLVAAGVYYVTSPVDGPLIVVLMVTLYGVAATGRTVAAAVLAALTVAGVALGSLRGNDDMNGVALVMMTGWVVAMVALGAAGHNRREALRAAAERAAEQARLRATEERLRIARELHDAVGHNISMINVQAGTALHRLAADPGRAEAALAVIKDASKQTLRELRATLGVLRQVDEDAPVRPPGGLARLDELARHAELAGLAAAVEVRGAPRPLPATSTWPPTASSRSRSPTWSGTPRPGRCGCWSTTTRAASGWRSTTTARAPRPGPVTSAARARRTAAGSSGCASAPAPWAASCPPDPSPTAVSGCAPGCPTEPANPSEPPVPHAVPVPFPSCRAPSV